MFRRLANLIRGFAGLALSGMERRSPEALLEVEQENLRRQIAQFNDGLANHAAHCERLMAQLRKLEDEAAENRAKAAAHLQAGNRDAAGEYALRLQAVERDQAQTAEQLRLAEAMYTKLVENRDAAVKLMQAKIDALKHKLHDLKIQKAMAELGEMAAGMNTALGSSGDTFERLHSLVEEQGFKAAGKARVARDVLALGAGPAVQEGERKALAERALAELAARENLALPPAKPADGASGG